MKEEWILICNIAVVRKEHFKKADHKLFYENRGSSKVIQIPTVARTTTVEDLEDAVALIQSVEKSLDAVGTKIVL